jgi:carbonyl reductase 1
MENNKKKVAVVTGSYRGIGLEIVKGLCKKFDGDVFVTARNAESGLKSVQELEKQGMTAKFHQLDIENEESILNFANFIRENYGGIDILVNNAAIFFKVF